MTSLRLSSLALAAGLLLSGAAYARPPADAPKDAERSQFFHSLKRDSDHFPCCSESDCRAVNGRYRYDEHDHHYYVMVERKNFVMDQLDAERWAALFPGKDEVEMMVPIGDVTIRTDNPTGSAILCYSTFQNTIYCFVPWDTLE